MFVAFLLLLLFNFFFFSMGYMKSFGPKIYQEKYKKKGIYAKRIYKDKFSWAQGLRRRKLQCYHHNSPSET